MRRALSPTMHPFLQATAGGALIGISVSLYLWSHGKIAGISGLLGGLFVAQTQDKPARASFLVGLVLAGLGLQLARPQVFGGGAGSLWGVAIAGVLVGFGTRLGNGCTSGHGICGITRFSMRSLLATATFIAAGIATVAGMRLWQEVG